MKKLYGIVAIKACSIFVTLVLYEVVLRLFFPPPQLVDIRKFSSTELLGPTSADEPKRKGTYYLEMEKGRRLQQNMRVKIAHHRTSGLDVMVETNSLGYRNRELKPKEAKRILFLGDSITLADYLNEVDTFVRQVEQLAKGRTEPIETINAGIGGESLRTYLYVLEETGLSIKPDVVVVGLYLNDFQPSRSIRLFYPPEFLQWSWAANYLYHVFSKKYAQMTREPDRWHENLPAIPKEELQRWADRIICCFSQMEPSAIAADDFKSQLIEHIHDWGGAWSEEAWSGMEKTLVRMKAQLDADGIPLSVVLFPVRHQVEQMAGFDFPQRQARQIAQKWDIPLLDALPILRAEHQRSQERLFYDDCHHTAYASRILAEHILTFLVEQGVVSALRE